MLAALSSESVTGADESTAPATDRPLPVTQLPVHRPKVSIGLPVYNGGRYLERALTSLHAQTFADLEIVVSDNASTDNTRDIIRRAAERDSRVRYSFSEVNRGLVWNHRRVIALARGEYFMFAPHDDWFAEDYVERCVELLDARPDVTYALAESILVDAEGNEVGRERLRQRVTDPSPSTRFWDLLVVQGGVNWYGMARREVFARIAPYRSVPRSERIVLAELALRGPFGVVPGRLYFRRVHDEQATALRRARRAEAAVLDPRRASGLRGSEIVLVAEYALGFLEAIVRAPLGVRERLRALRFYVRWLLGHVPGLAIADPRARDLDIERTGTAELPAGRAGIGY